MGVHVNSNGMITASYISNEDLDQLDFENIKIIRLVNCPDLTIDRVGAALQRCRITLEECNLMKCGRSASFAESLVKLLSSEQVFPQLRKLYLPDPGGLYNEMADQLLQLFDRGLEILHIDADWAPSPVDRAYCQEASNV